MLLGVEQLEAEEGEDGGLEQLDQLVDLLHQSRGDLDLAELLHEARGVLVVLRQEADGERGDGVVAPAAVEGGEECPALLEEGGGGERGEEEEESTECRGGGWMT